MGRDSFDPDLPPATQVRRLSIRLEIDLDAEGVVGVDGAPDNPLAKYSARYEFPRIDANGRLVDTRDGNAVPHMTPAQRTAIMSFLDAWLLKAQGSIPPQV